MCRQASQRITTLTNSHANQNDHFMNISELQFLTSEKYTILQRCGSEYGPTTDLLMEVCETHALTDPTTGSLDSKL